MPNNPNDRNQGGQDRGRQGQAGNQRTGNEGGQQQSSSQQSGQQNPQRTQSSQQGSDRSQNMSSGSRQGSQSQQSSGRGGDINLRLTPEQQAQIRQATGKNLQSLSLSVEDLGQGETQGTSSSSRGESYSSSRTDEDATGDERGMDEEV